MSSGTIKCSFCQSDVTLDNLIGNLVICNHCYGSFKLEDPKKKAQEKRTKIIIASVILISAAIGAKVLGLFDSNIVKLEKTVSTMGLEQAEALNNQCLRAANKECLRITYKRLTELVPTDVSFQANYAFILTDLKKHQEALPIYDKLIEQGEGTYDLMAYYGTTLDALGETTKAIDWFQNSLSINPNLVDITQKLAVAMTKEKRHYEAVSLLEAFVSKFPLAEGSLKGNLVSIKSQIKENPVDSSSLESLKLLTIRGSHYFLPIGLGENKQMLSFMVDTGASDLVMKTEDIAKFFPDAIKKATKTKVLLADGRKENAFFTVIPEVQIGSWKIKNIETVYCDNCVSLAGRSLLSKFSMKTVPKGEIETLELSLAN